MSDLDDRDGALPEEAPVTVDDGEGREPLARRARHRRRPGRRRWLWRGLAAGVAAVLVAGVAWFEIEANPLGAPGARVVLDVRPGEPMGAVVADLARQKVIGSALAFRLDDLVRGTPTVVPGHYLLHQNVSFGTVRGVLQRGPNVFAVNVLPGLTLNEVATQVDAVPGHTSGGFLAAAHRGSVSSPLAAPTPPVLEGLLGTGTYLVLPGETDQQLLAQMASRFVRQAGTAGLTEAAAQAKGLSENQLVTVASIVEKEGYIAKNMGRVARVVYNRLARGLPLQMDATVLYALGHDGGPVTSADLKVQSPYNTYLHSGLPPTPICVPSVTALRAALDPPPGSWLYFVLVKKDGTMAFSDTLAQQLANERLAKSRGLP